MSGRAISRTLIFILILVIASSACAPQGPTISSGSAAGNLEQVVQAAAPDSSAATPAADTLPTSFPERPLYGPGELVDYTAQTGDTLPVLAIRFNTTVTEILSANTFIPPSATTMPPGMPMKIPIYYLPFWGSPYQILPDSLFIDGPSQVDFDTQKFVSAQPGWLKNFVGYVGDSNLNGAQIIDYIALNYSVSPRLLLALLEYQTGALSQPTLDPALVDYPLGYTSWDHKGLYMQLNWAANLLNNGYYGWRTGDLTSIIYGDGRMERFDPWQNAATVGLHNYFNQIFSYNQYVKAIAPEGFVATYLKLFGDPWQNVKPHIPGSLAQPELFLPFEVGHIWAFTGGPHTGWGKGAPYAAIDFAPPAIAGGCLTTPNWATAAAPGKVVRSETGIVVLDLDGDGDERTGWEIFYLHIGTEGRAQLGATLQRGDLIGHPSCEGGSATGTHIHLARKYNGEWIPADGTLALNFEGWIVHNGREAYLGKMTRNNQSVVACVCSNQVSFIQTDRR